MLKFAFILNISHIFLALLENNQYQPVSLPKLASQMEVIDLFPGQENLERLAFQNTGSKRRTFRKVPLKVNTYDNFTININQLFNKFMTPNCDDNCRRRLFDSIKPFESVLEISPELFEIISVKKPFENDLKKERENQLDEQNQKTETETKINNKQNDLPENSTKNSEFIDDSSFSNKVENHDFFPKKEINWPKEPQKHAPTSFTEKQTNNSQKEFEKQGLSSFMQNGQESAKNANSNRLLLAIKNTDFFQNSDLKKLSFFSGFTINANQLFNNLSEKIEKGNSSFDIFEAVMRHHEADFNNENFRNVIKLTGRPLNEVSPFLKNAQSIENETNFFENDAHYIPTDVLTN